MKKRMILAALLLLVFGTMKAQVNEPKPIDPKTDSIIKSRMAELSQSQEQFAERMREMGVVLQQLSDSVNWEKFERDMEQWGKEMEQWGRKMEEWGEQFEIQFENKFDKQNNYHPSKKEDPQVHAIVVEGSGDVLVNKYGKVISYQYQREQRAGKQSRLLNPHWNGFEAGLNMLIDPFAANVYTGPNESMAIRPLRSWYFGFNLADIGIAFDRKKMVGVFTGIGLGWNNYSWKNYISMTVENNELVNTLLPDDRPVKNSKFGLLYVQVPLMIEVRPTRHLYIDFGVTGGIRVAAWNRIKFCDGENRKTYSNYLTNLFKCDASLRVGGDNLGFFVSYALVPTFVKGRDAAKAHPLMLGLSINL